MTRPTLSLPLTVPIRRHSRSSSTQPRPGRAGATGKAEKSSGIPRQSEPWKYPWISDRQSIHCDQRRETERRGIAAQHTHTALPLRLFRLRAVRPSPPSCLAGWLATYCIDGAVCLKCCDEAAGSWGTVVLPACLCSTLLRSAVYITVRGGGCRAWEKGWG